MKPINILLSSPDQPTKSAPIFVKILTFSFVSLSLFFVVKHFSDSALPTPFFISFPGAANANYTDPPRPLSSPPRRNAVVERTGIVDENGFMTEDFVVGDFDLGVIETVVNESGVEAKSGEESQGGIRIGKFEKCDGSLGEYVPCLDNVEEITRLNSSTRGEKYERHCPESAKGLDCLVPRPNGYKSRIPWPQSRDEVWFDNVPHTKLVEDKGGQNWIVRKNDKFIFPGGGTQFIHGADQYLDQISKMVPEIAFGHHVRVALDVGCGVASFGAFLLGRNVTTLSIAPKDGHKNQIQFALERGVPAMIAVLATHRLPYPSQAFELVHCSRCRVNWTRDDGILLLEVDRILRAGGYFVWAAQPVYKHEDNLQEQWKEMENLTDRICWELVKKEGYIAIWRKPLNNSCYLGRELGIHPAMCDANDDEDNAWYVGLKPCITWLPKNGFGANVTTWPERLRQPPQRLLSVKIDGYESRKDIYKADSKYWNGLVSAYINIFRWKETKPRNVMDMRTRFGGFAAALYDSGIDCWVMNIVPVSGANTLPVIYDRGLIGVMHDWCEPFDTYPRTYDLLHAAGLFSAEQKRCNISTIMLEMDRILRPDGRAYIRDSTAVIYNVQEFAKAMGWVTFLFDDSEGPHSMWKLLTCEKRL